MKSQWESVYSYYVLEIGLDGWCLLEIVIVYYWTLWQYRDYY